jgi:hypothetical protein
MNSTIDRLTLAQELREILVHGTTFEPFGTTRLIARAHKQYCGPVYRWAGLLWISYNDRPVEVVRMHGQEFEERH